MKRAIQIVIVALLLVSIVISIWRCAEKIRETEQADTYSDLQSYTEQSAAALAQNVAGIERLLQSLSREYAQLTSNGYSVEQCVGMFTSLDGVDSFRRLGVSLPDGSSYTTDGLSGDLSAEENFDTTFEGYFTVSDTIYDTFDESAEAIHVFRYPVIVDGEVIAQVFATYAVGDFQQLLGFDELDDEGRVMALVSSDGSIICGTNGSEFDIEGVSLIEKIAEDGGNLAATTSLSAELAAGEEGSCVYTLSDSDDERLLYHAPIDASDSDAGWQLVCSLSTSAIDSRVNDVMHDVYRMMAIVVVIVIAIIAVLGSLAFFAARRHRKDLENIAYVDPLTGGHTKLKFSEMVKASNRSCVIVALDIRSFKTISSICGKEASKKIIVSMHEIIHAHLREGELCAREESDRFFIAFHLAEGETVEDRLRPIFTDIAALSESLQVPQLKAVAGSCSWGQFDDLDGALNNASAAKRELSGRKDATVQVIDYTQIDIAEFERARSIETAFAPALSNGEFEAWYQPKYRPRDGALVGAEALVRWRKPDGTLVPPYQFIPLFESNGMVRDLDEYMFERVCREQVERVSSGKSAVPVSINLSRASLYFGDVSERYKAIVERTGVDFALVPLEITESAAEEGSDLRKLADDLVNAGFMLIMDDFGSGYSSLASLSSMRFEGIKIDKSLVDNIGNSNGEKLIKHSMALAQDLEMHITAEGVETESQVDFLRNLNCDDIQGYYYSRPLPRDEFDALL